jgi:hypothetical protein
MKARIADPEKISIARQRHGKQASLVTNIHATTEELLETVFFMHSVSRLYKENQREFLASRKHE